MGERVSVYHIIGRCVYVCRVALPLCRMPGRVVFLGCGGCGGQGWVVWLSLSFFVRPHSLSMAASINGRRREVGWAAGAQPRQDVAVADMAGGRGERGRPLCCRGTGDCASRGRRFDRSTQR